MKQTELISVENIYKAKVRLKNVAIKTPLMYNQYYSEKYNCTIYLKREDLQVVRSYKIRGAYNRISTLEQTDQNPAVVCASAGNHAQGVAYSCQLLKVKATIFMPAPTPNQKVDQVKFFGKDFVEIILLGERYPRSPFTHDL